MSGRAQIIATIGPSGEKPGVLKDMVAAGVDLARFNFEWFHLEKDEGRIAAVREAARSSGRQVKIIADLPGARVQLDDGHTYDPSKTCEVTDRDREMLAFCVGHAIEYVALSFIGSEDDVRCWKDAVKESGGSPKIIAKIERKAALDRLSEIIAESDAVMVARGDLGKEVPIQEIPFSEERIITEANAAGKPVIVATGLLLSMTENLEPTRAEVTDVETAVTLGADAVMLSEETASGKHPVEAVAEMARLLSEVEKHREPHAFHTL